MEGPPEANHVSRPDRRETTLAENPAEAKARYDALLANYGKPFKEQYGWAAAALNKGRPSFADIELAMNEHDLRPYYQLASHPVHANAKGLYFKLGAFEQRGAHALATNHGFATPASNAVVSVVQTIGALLMLAPSLDSIVNVRLVQKLANSGRIGVRPGAARRGETVPTVRPRKLEGRQAARPKDLSSSGSLSLG